MLKYPENEERCVNYIKDGETTHLLTRPPRSDEFNLYKREGDGFVYIASGRNPLELEAEHIDKTASAMIGGDVTNVKKPRKKKSEVESE